MAPVGPLDFVARQASVWIMTFYISTTSFVTFIGWTLDSFRVPEEVRMRYQTTAAHCILKWGQNCCQNGMVSEPFWAM